VVQAQGRRQLPPCRLASLLLRQLLRSQQLLLALPELLLVLVALGLELGPGCSQLLLGRLRPALGGRRPGQGLCQLLPEQRQAAVRLLMLYWWWWWW
jgi:hypothetical protein